MYDKPRPPTKYVDGLSLILLRNLRVASKIPYMQDFFHKIQQAESRNHTKSQKCWQIRQGESQRRKHK